MSKIPSTREEAITVLVDQDCAKWGESEREASRRMHGDSSYGIALNELARRAELDDAADDELRTAANRALTAADWRELREGG